MKHLRRALRLPIEWVGIGFALCVIPWLPRRGLFACCDLLSALMYHFDRRGKRLALANLRIITGGGAIAEEMAAAGEFWRLDYAPTTREEKIIRRSYRNMARTVGYAFWTSVRAQARCAQTGVVSEAVERFLKANRPAVTVSGHLGCWEILSQLAFLEGHQMISVAKDIGTRGMTKLLMFARKSIGQEIIPAEGAFKPLLAALRAGKSLGLLVDQNVSPRKGGVWVRFLGRPMPVSAAPAFFAGKVKSPIIVAWSRPLKDGRYRCEWVDAVPAEEARDIWALTQRIMTDLERIIRRHPSCWVLNYKYFKRVPTDKELAQLEGREQRS